MDQADVAAIRNEVRLVKHALAILEESLQRDEIEAAAASLWERIGQLRRVVDTIVQDELNLEAQRNRSD